MPAAVVRHASQDQLGPAALDHHMFVVQDPDAQAGQLDQPGLDAGVVLVITGDEVAAVA
jgi:hypothetical protein